MGGGGRVDLGAQAGARESHLPPGRRRCRRLPAHSHEPPCVDLGRTGWHVGRRLCCFCLCGCSTQAVQAGSLQGHPPVPLRPLAQQVRRRLVGLRFFLFTLRRNRPVALNVFYDAVASTYAACGFSRQLAPEQLAQLAVQAGFSQTAAAALQRRAAADAAAAAAAASSAGEDVQLSPGHAVRGGAAVWRLPAVSIPRWRYKYFQWWLRR